LTTAEQRQLRDLLGKAVAADALLAAEGEHHDGRLGTASQRSPRRPAASDGQPSGRSVPVAAAKRPTPNGARSMAGTRPRTPSATRAPQ
jgi:hypothetical protein